MGSVYTKARSWTAPWDGVMVYAGGHLHGGGIDLTLKDLSTGFQCVMTAHYDMPMDEMFAMPADMGMMDPPTMIDPCPGHNLVGAGKAVFADRAVRQLAAVHGRDGDRARRTSGAATSRRPAIVVSRG